MDSFCRLSWSFTDARRPAQELVRAKMNKTDKVDFMLRAANFSVRIERTKLFPVFPAANLKLKSKAYISYITDLFRTA